MSQPDEVLRTELRRAGLRLVKLGETLREIARSAPDAKVDVERQLAGLMSGPEAEELRFRPEWRRVAAVVRQALPEDGPVLDREIEAIVTDLESQGLDPADLDALVHDLASGEASNANNGGLAAQVRYMLNVCGVDGCKATIEQLVPRAPRFGR